jgi:hypothetical protein
MTPEVCVHFWRVNDRGTRGICLKCGKTAVYKVDLTGLEYKKQMAKARIEVKKAMGVGEGQERGRERNFGLITTYIYRKNTRAISKRT